MKPLNIFLCITLVFIFVSLSSAELYMWVDENGVKRYTDIRVPGAERIDNLDNIPAGGLWGVPKKKVAAIVGVLLLNIAIVAVVFFIRRRYSVVLNVSKSTSIRISNYTRSTRQPLAATIKYYIRRFTGVLSRASLLVIAVTIVYGAVLSLCKILWFSYTATPIGQRYVILFKGQAGNISKLLGGNMLTVAVQVTVLAFGICLTSAIIFQFLHLIRHLYLSRGDAGRMFLFGCPLNAATAYLAQPQLHSDQWSFVYGATLLPTLCVLNAAFAYAQKLVPEIGQLIGQKHRHRGEVRDLLFLRPLNNANSSRLLEFDSLAGRLTGNRIDNPEDDDLSAGIYTKVGSHDLFFYRQCNERVFRCDHHEITLRDDMRLQIQDQGPWKRYFKIEDDGKIIFDIQYPHRTSTGSNRHGKNEKQDFFQEMQALANA